MKSFAVATTLLAAVMAANTALAEGGYFSGTTGARAAGRAGAFAARADDLSAMTSNPAGLADVDGTLVQIGNRISYNAYKYTRASTLDYGNLQNGVAPTAVFRSVENQRPWQALEPLLGVASRLGLSNWTFALAALAPPGAAREQFPSVGGKDYAMLDAGQRYMMVEREAIIVSAAASAAWRYRNVFGIGATVQWIYVPRLTYSLVIDGAPLAGAANPVSSGLDMVATMKGSDPFTLNATLGAWFRPTPSFELALSGQILPAKMVTHSTLTVDPIDKSLGTTVDLTRDGSAANDVTVTLPLPLLARAAARYRHLVGGHELYDLELDVEYETWSRVQRFTVDTNHLQANYAGQPIDLNRIEIEKHWQDTLGFKLGGDYAAIPGRLTLRGGLLYATAVAPAAYANVDFPGAAQFGAAAGTSLLFGRWEVAVAYQFRVQRSVTVSEQDGRVYQTVPASACKPPYTDTTACNPHTLGTPGPVINAGTYDAHAQIVSLDLIYRYAP